MLQIYNKHIIYATNILYVYYIFVAYIIFQMENIVLLVLISF